MKARHDCLLFIGLYLVNFWPAETRAQSALDGFDPNATHGNASGSKWTLTGLNLSLTQNLYIRARGYYRTGLGNRSESITEFTRNVFIPTDPPPLKIISMTRTANDRILLHCLGVPNQINNLQVSPDLTKTRE